MRSFIICIRVIKSRHPLTTVHIILHHALQIFEVSPVAGKNNFINLKYKGPNRPVAIICYICVNVLVTRPWNLGRKSWVGRPSPGRLGP